MALGTHIFRHGEQYYVGKVGNRFVWAKRHYFAARFINAVEARAFVRAEIATFCGTLESCHIVKMKPRRS